MKYALSTCAEITELLRITHILPTVSNADAVGQDDPRPDRVLGGSLSSHLLDQLGAELIKIEPPAEITAGHAERLGFGREELERLEATGTIDPARSGARA